jgi:hypothetical protein
MSLHSSCAREETCELDSACTTRVFRTMESKFGVVDCWWLVNRFHIVRPQPKLVNTTFCGSFSTVELHLFKQGNYVAVSMFSSYGVSLLLIAPFDNAATGPIKTKTLDASRARLDWACARLMRYTRDTHSCAHGVRIPFLRSFLCSSYSGCSLAL